MITLSHGHRLNVTGDPSASPLNELAAVGGIPGIDDPRRHFTVHAGATLTLSDLRLTGGRVWSRGGGVSGHNNVGASILVTGPSSILIVQRVHFIGTESYEIQEYQYASHGSLACSGRNEVGMWNLATVEECKAKCSLAADCVSIEWQHRDSATNRPDRCQASSSCTKDIVFCSAHHVQKRKRRPRDNRMGSLLMDYILLLIHRR